METGAREDRVDGLANGNSERTSINMHWDLEKKLIYSWALNNLGIRSTKSYRAIEKARHKRYSAINICSSSVFVFLYVYIQPTTDCVILITEKNSNYKGTCAVQNCVVQEVNCTEKANRTFFLNPMTKGRNTISQMKTVLNEVNGKLDNCIRKKTVLDNIWWKISILNYEEENNWPSGEVHV